MSPKHVPVLLQESIVGLNVRAGGWFLDATLGAGGHTRAMLELGANVVGIEQHEPSLVRTTETLNEFAEHFVPVLGRFGNLSALLTEKGITKLQGALFDLGFSSDQLSDVSVGMSFQVDAPLDMRLSLDLGVTAADLVNGLTEQELVRLFQEFGEVDRSRRIAQAIVEFRRQHLITSTTQLRQLIESVYGGHWRDRIHPATKVFQALRIVVNDELGQLEAALAQVSDMLESGGRLAVVSFHSLEDRIVKRFINSDVRLEPIKPFPIMPSEGEIEINSRARSAKLRIAQKTK